MALLISGYLACPFNMFFEKKLGYFRALGYTLSASLALVGMPLLVWSPAVIQPGSVYADTWQPDDGPPLITCTSGKANATAASNGTHFYITGEEPLLVLCSEEEEPCPTRTRICAEGEEPFDLYFDWVAPLLTAGAVLSSGWCLLVRLYYRDLEKKVLAGEIRFNEETTADKGKQQQENLEVGEQQQQDLNDGEMEIENLA